MINAYVGLPGSGKSYSAVAFVILPALAEGRRVVTNIPIRTDALKENRGELVQFETKEELLAEATPGSVLVIDEAWEFWPAGVRAKDVPQEERDLFAMHRHRVDELGRAMQITLVTQDLGQIAAFLRALVDTTFRTVKLDRFGLARGYRVDVYQGAVSGPRPPKAQLLRQLTGRYRPEVCAVYQSHTQAAAEVAGVDESVTDRRRLVWASPRWWLLMPLCVVGVAAAAVAATKFFRSGGGLVDASPPPPATASVASVAAAEPRERRSSWTDALRLGPQAAAPRIAASALRSDGSGLVLIEYLGRTYSVDASACWRETPHELRCRWRGQVVMP